MCEYLPSDQHHSDRGPAADRPQHGPCGMCGDRRRQEVHVYEGIHQLSVLQRGETFKAIKIHMARRLWIIFMQCKLPFYL